MASYADRVRGRVAVPWTMLQDTTECIIQAAEIMEVVVVTASGGLHPTKSQPGEQLPEGFSRSYAGFLIRDLQREIRVDQAVINEEVNYLSEFAAIACFVGGRPPASQLRQWTEQLQHTVQGNLSIGRNLGKGFFVMKATSPEAMKRLLLTTPHRSPQGLCIFQKWIPGFCPSDTRVLNNNQTMKIPTWILLR